MAYISILAAFLSMLALALSLLAIGWSAMHRLPAGVICGLALCMLAGLGLINSVEAIEGHYQKTISQLEGKRTIG